MMKTEDRVRRSLLNQETPRPITAAGDIYIRFPLQKCLLLMRDRLQGWVVCRILDMGAPRSSRDTYYIYITAALRNFLTRVRAACNLSRDQYPHHSCKFALSIRRPGNKKKVLQETLFPMIKGLSTARLRIRLSYITKCYRLYYSVL